MSYFSTGNNLKRPYLHHAEHYYIINVEISNGAVQASTGEQKID